MTHLKTLVAVLAVAAAPTAFAAGATDDMNMRSPAAEQVAARRVAAEIRKIDAQAGKVTLKHGPIENLSMPGMTMAFPVKDRASLQSFKEGDTVWAVFEQVGGQPTVVDMRRR